MGAAVVGAAVVGAAVVGAAVVGAAVVGAAVVGSAVVGPAVVGPAVVGPAVVGPAVVGAAVVVVVPYHFEKSAKNSLPDPSRPWSSRQRRASTEFSIWENLRSPPQKQSSLSIETISKF